MPKLKANFFISLDGVVETPENWHFPYHNDEVEAEINKADGSTAFLMGRRLYDGWSQFWPQQEGNDDLPFERFINNVDKYVVSDTLSDPTWKNTTVISGDVASEIRALKERNDGDIAMSGSATLVRWLLANGLLDELHLLVHPLVVGEGGRLFDDTASQQKLE